MNESFRILELPDGKAAITGVDHAPRRLFIPSQIEGRRTAVLASRACSDKGELEELVLPETLEEIESYAIYNCPALGRLSLSDLVEEAAGSCIRLCPKLQEIEIRVRRCNYRLIRDLAGEISARLVLTLHFPDGTARLLLPAYFQEIHEDTHARAIHQSIVGAGVAYRECLTRSGIDFRQYDACFRRVAAAEGFDPEEILSSCRPGSGEEADSGAEEAEPGRASGTAGEEAELTGAELALLRLMYPYRLPETAAALYEGYLRRRAVPLLLYLIRRRDSDAVRFLLAAVRLSDRVLGEASRLASRLGLTEIVSLLMDRLDRNRGGEAVQAFSLEDEDW